MTITKDTNTPKSNKPVIAAIITFVLVLLLTQYLTYQRFLLLENKKKQEVTTHAHWLREELHFIQNESLAATKTLAFIVEKYGIPQDFDSIAQLLLETNTHIEALEIVNKEGVITHVYPLEGNEVKGFNILKDANSKSGALTSIQRREYYMAGPVNLKQGEIGFVGRTPLFKNNEFTGFTAAVIKLPKVLEALNLESSKTNPFKYKLARINQIDGKEEFFFNQSFSAADSIHFVPIETNEGEWKLYVGPRNVTTISDVGFFAFLGFLLAIICGGLAWYIAKQPILLAQLVKEKTAELHASETKYRTFIEQASDGIFLTDINGNFEEVNEKGCEMFGYTLEEFKQLSIYDTGAPEEIEQIPRNIQDVLKEDNSISVERKLIRKDASFFYGEIKSKLLKNNKVLSIIRDITERKELELIANSNAEKFSKAFNNKTIGMAIGDIDRRILDINDCLQQMLGYEREEIIGKTALEIGLVKPTQTKQIEQISVALKEKGHIEAMSLEYYNKKQEKRYCLFFAEVFMNGEIPYLLSSFIDQTEAVVAQEQIKQSEESYRTLIERVSDGFISLDKNWNFNYINNKASKILKKDKQDLLNRNVWDIFPVTEGSEFYKKTMEAMETQKYIYLEEYHPRLQRWYEDHIYPSKEGVSVFFRDVTKKKIAQKEINELQTRMNAAVRIGKIGYWSWDLISHEVFWSDRMYRIFDTEIGSEVQPTDVIKKLHPEDAPTFEQLVGYHIKNRDSSPFTFRIIHEDKSVHHIKVQMEIQEYVKDKIVKYHGTAIDISEIVSAQQAVKDSEEKFSKAFHSNLIGMILVNSDRRIIEVNNTVVTILKTTRDYLIGKTVIEAGILEMNTEAMKNRELLWDKVKKGKSIQNIDITYQLTNGLKIYALLSIEPILFQDNINYLITIIDNTVKKEAEIKLANQNKELKKINSELDRFVYSASHELRAPLASVMGLIDLIKEDDDTEDLDMKLEMIERSIRRLDLFIKDIVEYSQNKHIDILVGEVNFSSMIQDSLETLWYLENRDKIDIHVKVKEDIPFFSDPKRIAILLNNFVSNAIKYHNVHQAKPEILIEVITSTQNATIKISDNGVGIPEEELENIFKMFYRVSSKVMGTGIGLFIVKEILDKLQGTIEVNSELKKGTTFIITVPNHSKKI